MNTLPDWNGRALMATLTEKTLPFTQTLIAKITDRQPDNQRGGLKYVVETKGGYEA